MSASVHVSAFIGGFAGRPDFVKLDIYGCPRVRVEKYGGMYGCTAFLELEAPEKTAVRYLVTPAEAKELYKALGKALSDLSEMLGEAQ